MAQTTHLCASQLANRRSNPRVNHARSSVEPIDRLFSRLVHKMGRGVDKRGLDSVGGVARVAGVGPLVDRRRTLAASQRLVSRYLVDIVAKDSTVGPQRFNNY